MVSINEFSFHESTVISFDGSSNKFTITLEDVKYQEMKVKVHLVVKHVTRLTVDDCETKTLSMPFTDGEVLSLEFEKEKLFILIEWNDFSAKTSKTHAYEIFGNELEYDINER
ncbi:hypothetical protein [Aliikangiella maris]|uniref:Uncharacterized protein n=2 Tax=Aliikangiella maris TaxID=3162458 RepID=A0ABV3MT84_9GAMM